MILLLNWERNGKVVRSHRNDNEKFYNPLKFYSLKDLRYQAKLYLKDQTISQWQF